MKTSIMHKYLWFLHLSINQANEFSDQQRSGIRSFFCICVYQSVKYNVFRTSVLCCDDVHIAVHLYQ